MKRLRSSSLADTLKQTKPFSSLEQELYLSLVRTSAELSQSIDHCLKAYGVTQAQYNVLRILRGAGKGLGRNEIRERMVNAMPDMTRMLDRMEAAGWVVRSQRHDDKRHFPFTIAPAGRTLLARLEKPIATLHSQQFAGIENAELERSLALLDEVRKNRSAE